MFRLLLTLVALSLTGCESFGSSPGSAQSFAVAYLRGVGDAVIRTEGTKAVKKYAPEAMDVLDIAPADDVLTLAEFEAVFASDDPVHIAWLTIVAYEIIKQRKEGI